MTLVALFTKQIFVCLFCYLYQLQLYNECIVDFSIYIFLYLFFIFRFYTFLLSNLVSLLLGAGIGAWVYRRSATTINAQFQHFGYTSFLMWSLFSQMEFLCAMHSKMLCYIAFLRIFKMNQLLGIVRKCKMLSYVALCVHLHNVELRGMVRALASC